MSAKNKAADHNGSIKSGAKGDAFALYDSMTEKQLDAYARDKRKAQFAAAYNDNHVPAE